MANLVIPTWISNLLLVSGVAHAEPNWNASVANGTITLKLEWNHVNIGTVVALPPNLNVTTPPPNVQPHTHESANQYCATHHDHTNSIRRTHTNSYATTYLDTNRKRYVAPPRFKRNYLFNRSRSDGDHHWRNYNPSHFAKRQNVDNTNDTKSTDPTITNTAQSVTEMDHQVYHNDDYHIDKDGIDGNITLASSSDDMQADTMNVTMEDSHAATHVSISDSISELDPLTNVCMSTTGELDDVSVSSNESDKVGDVMVHTIMNTEDLQCSDLESTSDCNDIHSINGDIINESQLSVENLSCCSTVDHQQSVVKQSSSVTNDVTSDVDHTSIIPADNIPRTLANNESPESLAEWTQSTRSYFSSFDDWYCIIERGWEKSSWSCKIPNRGLENHIQVIALEALFGQISNLCPFQISNSQFKGTNSLESIFKLIYTYYSIPMPYNKVE